MHSSTIKFRITDSCWHTIVLGNIYPPELFHKRYLHLDQTIENVPCSMIVVDDKERKIDYSYNSIITKIQPYAAIASQDPAVAEIFDTVFQKFDEIKQIKNILSQLKEG